MSLIEEPTLPFDDVDGYQVVATNHPGYGWTLQVLTHSPISGWSVRTRYERLAAPELGDVILQELGALELEL